MAFAPKTLASIKPPRARRKTAERGYDSKWQAFRDWFLRYVQPACADCNGRATEVHHVRKVATHPRLRLDVDNCLGLCKPCHSKRTLIGE
jgi:5-methylcytosine-specific restriction endonuclease McrA